MDVDYHVADEDLALAVVPGTNFNPKTRHSVTSERVLHQTWFCLNQKRGGIFRFCSFPTFSNYDADILHRDLQVHAKD